MGRVYNALVKADRLTGGGRPIGRPVSREAAAKDSEVFPAPVTPAAINEDSKIDFSFNRDGAASAPVYQSDSSFSLTDTFAAPRRHELFKAEPFTAEPNAEPVVTRRSVTSFEAEQVSRPSAPVFEEPRLTASIKNLTIDPRLVALTGEDPLVEERYRTLAVRVINAASRRKLKAIAITSAEEGEGKSTVAINLAWSMATRSNRRVLLIDASPRSPSISRMLGLSSPRGRLNLSDDSTGLAGSIVRLDPGGLCVLAQGIESTERGRQKATEVINEMVISTRFEKLLAELSQRFDFLVIDAPPIIGSADAQQLASIADGSVIVARAGITHHSRVSAALALVPEDRRMGIVLNESEIREEAAYHKAGRSLIDRLFGRMK
jgi:capsular exopolysaccharide synthesis family protein